MQTRLLVYVLRSCALAVIGLSFPAVASAEPRPYVFGMGHYLAPWAGQPWSYDAQAMDKMVEMGATSIWVDFAWAAMEPVDGQIDWAYADHQVNEAEARGLEMFAFVGTTPDWARLHANLPGHRTPPADEYLPRFNAFHAAVAARYQGRVKYFQFWNEPSGCSWINENCSNGHDCALFTLWQQRAYDALKAGNPDCVVSTGGFDGDPAGYVQCMYEHGGKTAFDAVSIHPYAGGGPGGPGTSGEAIDYSDLVQVRDVMVSNGDADKKIWITEYGWNTTNEAQRAEDLIEVLTELKKPQYEYVFYAKHLVLNDWTAGGEPFCCWGLTDSWFNPKPAYNAFKNYDKSWPQYVDFVADRNRGRGPLTVRFTDRSSITGASAWFWEFGDGATSAERHPAHTYTQNGFYTVRLTVTGDAGPMSEEKLGFIEVGVVTSIINPSYEDETNFLDGWSSCLRSQTSIKRDPTTHYPKPLNHHGNHRVGISSGRPGNDTGEGALWQQVAVVPGRTYRVRFWAVLTATDGQYFDDAIELRYRDGDADPLNCASNGAGVTDNSVSLARLEGSDSLQWRELAGDITPTQDVVTLIAFWDFNGTDWVINSLHLDDWSIEDITPPIPGDFDDDVDVDESDLLVFENCATGPALGPLAPDCAPADLDGDGDVDQSDFGLFQRCFSGMGVPAAPSCAD